MRLSLARRPSWPCRRHVRGRRCSPGPTEPHSQACLRASLQGSRAQVPPENSDTPKLHLKFSRAPPSPPDESPEGAKCSGALSEWDSSLCPRVHETCSSALSFHPSISIMKTQEHCDVFLNSEKSSCMSNE